MRLPYMVVWWQLIVRLPYMVVWWQLIVRLPYMVVWWQLIVRLPYMVVWWQLIVRLPYMVVWWQLIVCVYASLIPRPFPPPVFHRFQYEIRWGKAWEIWSRAMTSGRQMVDTRGAVPNHYNTCFTLIRHQRCEQRTVSIVCLANALISSHWTDSTTQDVEILRWALPSVSTMCLLGWHHT